MAAHTEHVHLDLVYCYPDHEPRESDPHYHLFNAARSRMEKAGLLKCWICGTDQNIQVHHALIEFALANGIDIEKFKSLCPEFHVESDEDFAAFVESEGNLLPLCQKHHTGVQGIHMLPYPAWQALRYWKSDLPSPGEKE